MSYHKTTCRLCKDEFWTLKPEYYDTCAECDEELERQRFLDWKVDQHLAMRKVKQP